MHNIRRTYEIAMFEPNTNTNENIFQTGETLVREYQKENK